jgi:nucleotide-binding universal stress UspA family protein
LTDRILWGIRSVTPHSLLCAVDFSEQSRHALRWAAHFAARFQGRLTVLSVVEPLLAEAAKIRLGQDLVKTTDAALREFVTATWRNDPPPASIDFKTEAGEVPATILANATAQSVDLIVVGTQGLGGVRKWLIGSTTERLLRRTHLPVLAVPPIHTDAMADRADTGPIAVTRILAALDFSESSLTALDAAVQLAEKFSATLTLLHVLLPVAIPPFAKSLQDDISDTRAEDARRRLEALAAERCGGRPCETTVSTGAPADRIAALAKSQQADLIVMGLASDQGIRAPRPGSVAYRVLCSTTVPVLVLPGSSL